MVPPHLDTQLKQCLTYRSTAGAALEEPRGKVPMYDFIEAYERCVVGRPSRTPARSRRYAVTGATTAPSASSSR